MAEVLLFTIIFVWLLVLSISAGGKPESPQPKKQFNQCKAVNRYADKWTGADYGVEYGPGRSKLYDVTVNKRCLLEADEHCQKGFCLACCKSNNHCKGICQEIFYNNLKEAQGL